MRFIWLPLLCLGALGAVGPDASPDVHVVAAAQEFMVVVHEDNPARAMGRDHLSKIFLKRTVKWPSGKATEPVDLSPHDKARAAFTKAVHRRSVSAVRAFWQQQIFSARDIPPVEKATEHDVVSYVRDHVGAVGYVSPDVELPLGVKTLIIEGLRP